MKDRRAELQQANTLLRLEIAALTGQHAAEIEQGRLLDENRRLQARVEWLQRQIVENFQRSPVAPHEETHK